MFEYRKAWLFCLLDGLNHLTSTGFSFRQATFHQGNHTRSWLNQANINIHTRTHVQHRATVCESRLECCLTGKFNCLECTHHIRKLDENEHAAIPSSSRMFSFLKTRTKHTITNNWVLSPIVRVTIRVLAGAHTYIIKSIWMYKASPTKQTLFTMFRAFTSEDTKSPTHWHHTFTLGAWRIGHFETLCDGLIFLPNQHNSLQHLYLHQSTGISPFW